MLLKNFGEKSWLQIQYKGSSTDITEIVFHSNYEIFLHGITICQTEDFVSALQITLACYLIFNLRYPKILEALYTFLQKQMLGLHGTIATPSKVLTLMWRLKASKWHYRFYKRSLFLILECTFFSRCIIALQVSFSK